MNILMIVTSHDYMKPGMPTGLWAEELAIPYREFLRAGYNVDIASPQGGAAPVDPRSVDSPPLAVQLFFEDPSAVAKLEATQRLDKLESMGARYDAYFVVGGHGIMWDGPANETLQKMLGNAFDEGRVVAAVCHGPAALVNVRLKNGELLVAGRRVNSFTDDEERQLGLDTIVPFLLESKLRERGALFEKSSPGQTCVAQDGRLLTGQNPASAEGLAHAVISVLAPQLSQA